MDHGFVDQRGSRPGICQGPAILIVRSNVGFQTHGRSRGQQAEKGRPGFRPDGLLLRFGAVDPDQPHPSAIGAAETVAV